MDDTLPLILKTAGETPTQGKQGKQGKSSSLDLDALSATFADMLQRAGQSLESGLNIVAEYTAQPSTAEKPEPKSDPKDPAPETETKSRDRRDDRADGTEDRRETPRKDRRDDYDRDSSDVRPRDDAGNPPVRDTQTNTDTRADDRPQDQTQPADTASDAKAPATDAANANDGKTGTDQNQAAAQNGTDANETSQSQTVTAGTDGNAAAVNPGLQTVQAILNQLIAAAETNTATGQTQDTGKGTGEGNAAAANALQGLAKAIAALGNQGAQQQNGQNNGQNLSPELQALAKAIVETRATGKPATDAAATTPTATAATTTTTQQQAQALAQAIGDGNKAQVAVKVTNEAATLVSQPTANLSANAAVTAGDGQNLPLHAQQAVQNAAAAAQNPGTQQAAAGNAGQAQTQQAATQNNQTQTLNTLASDVKAAGPALPTTAGQGAMSGGGEGSTSTGSHAGTQDTQQTQHTQQSQAATTTKFNVPRQAVMDQITVNIARGIEAGLDKINIQLRPESLGRVDVHLEMAKDGKVSAVIHADNKDTLDLLQRDGKELVKALQDAGMNLDDGDVSYNLRGQNAQANGDDGSANGGSGNADGTNENGNSDDTAANDDFQETDIIEEGRVNVRV